MTYRKSDLSSSGNDSFDRNFGRRKRLVFLRAFVMAFLLLVVVGLDVGAVDAQTCGSKSYITPTSPVCSTTSLVGFPCSSAVDGNIGIASHWASNVLGVPRTISVRVGSTTKCISRVKVYQPSLFASPTIMDVQVSDDRINWRTVDTGLEVPFNTWVASDPFSETGKFVRLFINNCQGQFCLITEIEVQTATYTPPVVDTTPPTVNLATGLNPADNANEVSPSALLILTFSEAVKKGSGNVVVRDSGGTLIQNIPLSSVSISGSVATITPPLSLRANTELYVEIASGVFKDLADNSYAGISGSTAWNFETGSGVFQISFVDPTPGDGITTSTRIIPINVLIEFVPIIKDINWNWDGTDYNIYDDSLKLMYNFDDVDSIGEVGIVVKDVSNGGNDGTCVGMGSSCVFDVGKYGGSIKLDGDNDQITTDLTQSSVFTWSAWFNTLETTSDHESIITIKSPDYILMSLQNLRGAFWSSDGMANVNLGVTGLSTNTWYHLVLVREGDNINEGYKAYLDGQLVGRDDTGVWSSVDVIRIGGREGFTSQRFKGNIDEVKIFDRALLPDEIYQLYISNLKKTDIDKWTLEISQGKDATNDLADGVYTYTASATDINDVNVATETRSIAIEVVPIGFEEPTPKNGITTSTRIIPINVAINDISNLKDINWNWDGTDYNIYDDSLKLMYNFDDVGSLGEGGTVVKDVSNGGKDGTCIAMGASCKWRSDISKYGGNILFDGTDGGSIRYVNVGNTGITGDWTVSLWVNIANSVPLIQYPVSTGGISGIFVEWGNSASSGGSSVADSWAFYDGSTGVFGSNLAENEWHFLTVTKTGLLYKIYLDGVPDGDISKTLANIDLTDVNIGSRDRTRWPFNGRLDDLKMFDRALSVDEIYQLYVTDLRKVDLDKWTLEISQGQDAVTSDLVDGVYTYIATAIDTSDVSFATETREIVVGSVDTTSPNVFFTLAPVDGTSTQDIFIPITVSINNEPNLEYVTWNWDDNDYTIYDNSLKLMMNFDKVGSLGERDNSNFVNDVSNGLNK